MKRPNLICLTALPLLLCAPAAALAQNEEIAGPPAPAALGDDTQEVAFTADALAYDENSDVVTVTGDVRMNSQGNRLRADKVVWTRSSDEVRAEGNVRLVTPEGDVAKVAFDRLFGAPDP